MLFKYYPQFDINIFYINVILDIILELFFIGIFLYIINRLYIKKEIKKLKEEKSNIINLITWALFFLVISIAHFLKILTSLLLFSNAIPEETVKIIEKIDILLIYFAFLIKIVYIEYVINSLKFYRGYFFSIIISVVIIFIIFIDIETLRERGFLQIIFLILSIVGYSILPILYLYLSIKTIRQSRKNAFKVSVGTFLFGIGSLFQPDNIVGYCGISELLDLLIQLTYIIGPITVIVSTILILDSFRQKSHTYLE
ncbi:MAG: hypothetical protein ACTSQJ_03095 [Promethearchaeota archaeon]